MTANSSSTLPRTRPNGIPVSVNWQPSSGCDFQLLQLSLSLFLAPSFSLPRITFNSHRQWLHPTCFIILILAQIRHMPQINPCAGDDFFSLSLSLALYFILLSSFNSFSIFRSWRVFSLTLLYMLSLRVASRNPVYSVRIAKEKWKKGDFSTGVNILWSMLNYTNNVGSGIF